MNLISEKLIKKDNSFVFSPDGGGLEVGSINSYNFIDKNIHENKNTFCIRTYLL